MAAERCTVDGTVNSLIFQNEDNGYTVLRLDTTDGEQITVVGCIPCAAPGEELIITGEWKHHPTHGVQIQADTVERYMPRSESGILSYLSSGAVKGVGPATAQLLVQRFGGETLDVLELEPERMTLLKGITARKAQEIAASFRAQAGMRRLMEFLAESGLSAALAVKLFSVSATRPPKRCAPIRIFCATSFSACRLLRRIRSVSYTHLDVYKRQEYDIYVSKDGYAIAVTGAGLANLNDVYYATGVYGTSSNYSGIAYYLQAVVHGRHDREGRCGCLLYTSGIGGEGGGAAACGNGKTAAVFCKVGQSLSLIHI